MLAYEHVWDDLLMALESSGLEILDVQNFIETATCNREFRCLCQKPGELGGSEFKAEVAFDWDTLMTAQSLYGPHSQGVARPLPSGTVSGLLRERIGSLMPSGGLELIIKYYFPAKNFESAGFLTRVVQGLIIDTVDHNNYPQVNFEISVAPDHNITIHQANAYYRWNVSLEAEHLDFSGLCKEVSRVLTAFELSGHFEESV